MGFFVNSVAVLMLLITEQLEQNLTCKSFLNTNALVKFIHLKKNVHVQYFCKVCVTKCCDIRSLYLIIGLITTIRRRYLNGGKT